MRIESHLPEYFCKKLTQPLFPSEHILIFEMRMGCESSLKAFDLIRISLKDVQIRLN